MSVLMGSPRWRFCWSLVMAGLVVSAAIADDASAKRKSIYDAKADARAAVEKATARAKHDGKRVLLMFGGDWCGWCHKLHGLFKTDDAIRKVLFNEYELVMIDTKAPNAAAFLEESSKGLENVGFPFLAVLDADGKLLKGQKTDPLEEGDHHDPKKVLDFLTAWKVEARDADVVLREALSRAASENKRVFLTFGAPWCGWCRRLEGFLARPEIAGLLDRNFLVVKVDVERMTHGQELMDRYRPKESDGIPWYVVLNAEGAKQGTADAAFGNIGYPFEPREIDAFVALFESQGKLGPEQVAGLRKGLEKAAEEIRSEQAKRKAAG